MARKGEVIDTGYPGIKQRVKDGKYIVTIDLGRQRKLDKKTGEMKLCQVKTQRTVATLKEAKAIQGENNKKKEWKTVTGLTGVILFQDALRDYIEYKKSDWGISHLERQKIFEKRLTAYFGNMDVRKIDPLDVEEFFRWCREGGGDYEAISNNTIIKVSSLLSRMYQWMMKAPKRYGVTDNPVEGTDALKKEFFEGMSLSVDELKYLIGYMLKNENDSSVFVMIGLAALAGLRRGEICGLRWGDIEWDSGRIHVVRQRAQVQGSENGWIILTPKGGNENGRTASERKERWAVMPGKLSELLRIAMRQQEAYSGRKVENDDYVYRTKANLVEGYLINPARMSTTVNALQNRCDKMRARGDLEPLPRFRLHDLRHTHVSLCLNHGVNPFMVAASVGHDFSTKEMGVTGSVYWHDDGNREEMAECLDKLIDVEIKVQEEEIELMTPKKRTSNRRNLRNDEI